MAIQGQTIYFKCRAYKIDMSDRSIAADLGSFAWILPCIDMNYGTGTLEDQDGVTALYDTWIAGVPDLHMMGCPQKLQYDNSSDYSQFTDFFPNSDVYNWGGTTAYGMCYENVTTGHVMVNGGQTGSLTECYPSMEDMQAGTNRIWGSSDWNTNRVFFCGGTDSYPGQSNLLAYYTLDDDGVTVNKLTNITIGGVGGPHSATNDVINIDSVELDFPNAANLLDFLGLAWEYDGSNPYDDPTAPDEGNPGDGSDRGGRGGGGDHDRRSDPLPIPGLPDLGATDTGFVTLYNPTTNQLQALADKLWDSSIFDTDIFQKLFESPMDAILGLSIVPISVTGSAANCVIGNYDSGVSMIKLDSQYYEIDCGSLQVSEFWGAYLDYAPYTKLMLWLPYIGFRQITPDDVMGLSVNIKYHVDVLSGSCVAYVMCDGKLIYSYQGQCSSQIPVAAHAYNNAVSGAIQLAGAVGSMIATGGMTAPLVAPGMAQTAINTMKGETQRSGGVGGTGGLMGVQKPYIVIVRPEQAVPINQNKLEGYPSLMSGPLSNFSGFTSIESIQLQGMSATEAEKEEILSLLKEGVIL